MHTVEPRTDAPPPCPSCGTPASAVDIRRNAGQVTGNYLCPAGHVWITKWAEVTG